MHMKNYRSTDRPNVTQGQIASNLETECLVYQILEFQMVWFFEPHPPPSRNFIITEN